MNITELTILVSDSKVNYWLNEMQRQLRNVQLYLCNVLTRLYTKKDASCTMKVGRHKSLLEPNHEIVGKGII